MAQITPRSSDYVPDGVHFDLPEEVYFAQHALGSTDLKDLYFRKEGWWWSSRHNPDRKPRNSKERTFGRALHAILLEGILAYQERFTFMPDRPANAVETIPQMKQAMIENGFNIRGTSSWAKEDWQTCLRNQLPDVPCWPNIVEDFHDQLGNRTVISALDDRMLRLMREIAVSPDWPGNKEIRDLFATGAGRPPLAEVSILKTLPNGIRRRWRIDRMFPAFDLDAKSLGNWSGRPLEYETGEIIAKNGHDIQRADYLEGRQAAYDFIQDGFQVYGGDVDQRSWISRFPTDFPTWDWVWLYYQKPDPAGRAPVIFPVMDITINPMARDPSEPRKDDGTGIDWTSGGVLSTVMMEGLKKKMDALALYQRCVRTFGLDRPWARVAPLHYTDEVYEPRIFLPSWIQHSAGAEAEYPDIEGDD